MKDIRKLKCWPILKDKGFEILEFKANGILYGRGCVLDTPLIKMQIEPLGRNQWMFFNGHHIDYLNAFQLNKKIQELFK